MAELESLSLPQCLLEPIEPDEFDTPARPPEDLEGLVRWYIWVRQQSPEYVGTSLPDLFSTGRFNVLASSNHLAEERTEPPGAIIAIPHATVADRDSRTLVPLLHGIHEAAEVIGPIEPLIWGNETTPLSANQTQKTRIHNRAFTAQRHLIQELYSDPLLNDGLLRITAVQSMLDLKERFHKIRSDSMEWIAIDALKRNLSPDVPIIWFDSDTPFVARDTIPALVGALKSRQAHFPHANLVVCQDDKWAEVPSSDVPYDEKVTALYGLTRWLIESQLKAHEPRGYVEESGLAMTLKTYLKIGGVILPPPAARVNPIGESKGLLYMARLMHTMLGRDVPLVSYVPNTLMGFSDRRFRHQAALFPPISLPQGEEGDDYIDYTAVHQNDSETGAAAGPSPPRPATAAELHAMVEFMVQRQESRPGAETKPALTIEHRRYLSRLIDEWTGHTEAPK